MRWWLRYKKIIEKNILGTAKPEIKDLSYWRNRLFTNFIIFLLPISLVALIPGVFMSVKGNIPLLAVFDICMFFSFNLIAFIPKLDLFIRKVLATVMLYLLAIGLLVFLGSFGPGLLYLLAITVFITLIFPVPVAYWSIGINITISILFALIIHFKLLNSPLTQLYHLGSWIAVSSNLIFLSIFCVVLLDTIGKGLQATILKEALLQKQLQHESKKLEQMVETLKHKNQELEQFAYIASHDLQEPLRTTTALVENLEKQYKGRLDDTADLYLNFLSQASTRMRTLITGLLEYSHIGKEKQRSLVNCNTLVKETISDLDASIKESKASIITDNLPQLPAYPLELKQVFQNLLSNALKFRQKNVRPQIKITAIRETDYWTFSIIDNGIGIEERFREKIFAIFQRLHPKSQYDGTGIGLAHCRKIIELHGGKIWVETNPNGGSIFRFKLPVTYLT